jgi:GntR family negative regulator for fad regulon and positive regulator of fabA
VRLDLAPTYTRLAVERAAARVLAALAGHERLDETPDAFAAFDWTLQKTLAAAAGNPIYALILNSFASFYQQLAILYFAQPVSRASSRVYYAALAAAAQDDNSAAAEDATRAVMLDSIRLWQQAGADVEPV